MSLTQYIDKIPLSQQDLMIAALALAITLAWLWKQRQKASKNKVSAKQLNESAMFIGYTPGSPLLRARWFDPAMKEYRWQIDAERGVRFPLDSEFGLKLLDERTGNVVPVYMGNVHTGQLTVWRLRDENLEEPVWEKVDVKDVSGQHIRPVRTVEQLEVDGQYLDAALEDGRELNMLSGMQRAAQKSRGWFWELARWQQIGIIAGLVWVVVQVL